MQVDDVDRRILRHLQEDPSMPIADLAERVGMSSGPCWRRLERLEKAGVIQGRRVDLDYAKLGYSVRVFLRITLDKTQNSAFDDFIKAARQVPEVETIQTLLGRVDVRMDIIARDLAHYQEIYKTRILALPHISDIEALLLVSEVKNTERLPI
ncbi:MAG TPA: Lrp/AsnC family transcriptional regulator [Paracoccaceae bacterium]|nr:Lrp/AsnC family transcriptional regulator [Paracoccaceae bacterium]